MIPLKVIVWHTGQSGLPALRHVIDRGDMELVGVKCFREDKAGRDAGEIAGRPRTGIKVLADEAAVLALDADCVIAALHDTAMADPTVPGTQSYDNFLTALRILRSGKNVVSPAIAPTHYRHLNDPEWFLHQVEDACREGNSTLHYTGIDPGFFTNALPFAIASASGQVTRVQTWEMLDYITIPRHGSLERMGFGKTEEQIVGDGKFLDWVRTSWGGVPYLMGDAFGVKIDGIETELRFWLAESPIVTPHSYRVEKGTVAAYQFALHGMIDGEPVFTVNHLNRLGPDTGPAGMNIGHSGGYRIIIDGSTPFTVDIPLGSADGAGAAFDDAYEITAAALVNMVPAVVSATPGYKTFLDLGLPRPWFGKQVAVRTG